MIIVKSIPDLSAPCKIVAEKFAMSGETGFNRELPLTMRAGVSRLRADTLMEVD
jgi:hypothetical protein